MAVAAVKTFSAGFDGADQLVKHEARVVGVVHIRLACPMLAPFGATPTPTPTWADVS